MSRCCELRSHQSGQVIVTRYMFVRVCSGLPSWSPPFLMVSSSPSSSSLRIALRALSGATLA
ncbi:hypothetical protein XM48_09330 [Leucobacter sp. Ag1]|nr:hypothetical protein XM48_09330 [Leucobacter sp. Ag1]